MGRFADNIRGMFVPKGKVAVFWAGQAGYIIKTSENKLIALDIYLSDCCERYFGFKRVMPYLLEAHELSFDYVIASHGHYDHFDVDSVPALMRGDTKFIGAMDTKAECERLGITKNTTFLNCGDQYEADGFTLTGVPCDHGADTPYALGLWFEIEGKTIYYMGDTAFRKDYLENPRVQSPNLLLAPINGMFGNLDSKEAAAVAEILKPEVTVPCHFWNFVQHGGNPNEFISIMEEKQLPYHLLRMGEGILI